jgi:hypothetical protein
VTLRTNYRSTSAWRGDRVCDRDVCIFASWYAFPCGQPRRRLCLRATSKDCVAAAGRFKIAAVIPEWTMLGGARDEAQAAD